MARARVCLPHLQRAFVAGGRPAPLRLPPHVGFVLIHLTGSHWEAHLVKSVIAQFCGRFQGIRPRAVEIYHNLVVVATDHHAKQLCLFSSFSGSIRVIAAALNALGRLKI